MKNKVIITVIILCVLLSGCKSKNLQANTSSENKITSSIESTISISAESILSSSLSQAISSIAPTSSKKISSSAPASSKPATTVNYPSINENGTSLWNTGSTNIIADGDILYYYFNNAIKSVNKDGSGIKTIIPVSAAFFDVYDGWIYYVKDSSSKNQLFKVKKDGTSNTMLISDSFFIGIKALKNYIYYYSKVDDYFILNRVNNDGSNKITIGRANYGNFGGILYNITYDGLCLTDNNIYYSYNKAIYKCDLDGKNKTKIYNILPYTIPSYGFQNPEVTSISVMGNYIYYSYCDAIFRSNIDGSNLIKYVKFMNSESCYVLSSKKYLYLSRMGRTIRIPHGQAPFTEELSVYTDEGNRYRCDFLPSGYADDNYIFHGGPTTINSKPAFYIGRSDLNAQEQIKILEDIS